MHDLPIREYLHQVWKRRNIVLVFAIAVVTVTALVTLRQPKVYRAVAVIEIGAETPDVAFFQDVVNVSPYSWWSALKYYETQYEIIRSRALLTKVATRVIESGQLKGWSVESLTGHLSGGLSVGSDEKSRLARLYFEDGDPDRAQILANAVAETYADNNLSQKLEGVTQAVNWLNQRLTDIRKEKRQQEEELQKYQEEYKIVSLADGGNSAKANLVALTETLNRLKSQRIEHEAQYNKLRQLVSESKVADELLGVVSNELLIKLKDVLSERKAELGRLTPRYLEKHPRIVQLNQEIDQIGKAILQEVSNEVSRMKTRFLLAKAEEESIAVALDKQKLETLRIEELNRRFTDIKVITDTNQNLFETLQRKVKEADLSALVRSNNIRIVDRALRPGSPIRPDVVRSIFFALLLGLFGGVALALLLEYLDDTFKTNEDVERYLKMPLLGMIPRHAVSSENGGGPVVSLEFIPVSEPTSSISEFYRTLRTNVLFLTATRGVKNILIVSTGPGEGKTATAINLAVCLAQMGERTVLLDLDLRRPKLHHRFDSPMKLGVTNVLVGELRLEDAIQKSQIPNLDFIVAGSLPPNPAELLGCAELKKILDHLGSKYDRIIIDSSPIAPVTDAVVLSQVVDGVMLVVRASLTHRKVVLLARDQLKAVNANIMGAVLNDVDITRSTYSNYQYYQYGYVSYRGNEKPVEKKPSVDPQLPAGSA